MDGAARLRISRVVVPSHLYSSSIAELAPFLTRTPRPFVTFLQAQVGGRVVVGKRRTARRRVMTRHLNDDGEAYAEAPTSTVLCSSW